MFNEGRVFKSSYFFIFLFSLVLFRFSCVPRDNNTCSSVFTFLPSTLRDPFPGRHEEKKGELRKGGGRRGKAGG